MATNGDCPVREELQANYTTLLHPDGFTKSNTDEKHVMSSSAVKRVELSSLEKITHKMEHKLCQAYISELNDSNNPTFFTGTITLK